MNEGLLFLLFVLNAPLYVLIGACFFGDHRRFFGALRSSVGGTGTGAWSGERDVMVQEGLRAARIVAWAALSVLFVFMEYQVVAERLLG